MGIKDSKVATFVTEGVEIIPNPFNLVKRSIIFDEKNGAEIKIPDLTLVITPDALGTKLKEVLYRNGAYDIMDLNGKTTYDVDHRFFVSRDKVNSRNGISFVRCGHRYNFEFSNIPNVHYLIDRPISMRDINNLTTRLKLAPTSRDYISLSIINEIKRISDFIYYLIHDGYITFDEKEIIHEFDYENDKLTSVPSTYSREIERVNRLACRNPDPVNEGRYVLQLLEFLYGKILARQVRDGVITS